MEIDSFFCVIVEKILSLRNWGLGAGCLDRIKGTFYFRSTDDIMLKFCDIDFSVP